MATDLRPVPAPLPDNGVVQSCAVPDDVVAALESDPRARSEFALIPAGQKRQWLAHLDAATSADDRADRIIGMLAALPCLPPEPRVA